METAKKEIPAEILDEIIRLRDEFERTVQIPPYFPRGAMQFRKFVRPEDRGNPFAGLLFSFFLGDDDRIEIIEYFRKNPAVIPWNLLGTRAQIITACIATGIQAPAEVIAGGCGDPKCPACGHF